MNKLKKLEKRMRENIDRNPDLLLGDLVDMCDDLILSIWGLIKISPGYMCVRKDILEEIKKFVKMYKKVCEYDEILEYINKGEK